MDAPSKANEINETLWGAPVPCYNINMILIDEQGTKIHACANYYTIFKSSSQAPLKEGAQLIISGFNCVTNTASLKLTEHAAKIYFTKYTTVTPTNNFKSLNDGFEFVSFESIIKDEINKHKAFDVIGQIVTNKKLKQVATDDGPTSLIEYELQNTSGQKITCVLWGDDAENLQDYINKTKIKKEPIVIIIQLAKINIWEGSHQISNINKASKVYINSNHERISIFKERLKTNISNGTCREPHTNLKTSFDDLQQKNETTKTTKILAKTDQQKMNGCSKNTIIIDDEDEDEKEISTKKNKRCKYNMYVEGHSHEEKKIKALEIKSTPIEINNNDDSTRRIIKTKSNDKYKEKEYKIISISDDEEDQE